MKEVIIGNARLICADCRDVLPTLGMVDAVITDPPYGEKTHAGARTGKGDIKLIHFDSINGQELASYAKTFVNMSHRWVVFTCEWRYMHLLDDAGLLVRHGIWIKRNGAPQFTGDRPGTGWEAIAFCHRTGKKRWNGGGRHGVYDVPKIEGKHPTAKPPRLIGQFVLDFTDAGETILDPFMGTGETGVQAINLGRKFIGIEKDPEYFEIACKRIQEAWDSRALLKMAEKPKIAQGRLVD